MAIPPFCSAALSSSSESLKQTTVKTPGQVTKVLSSSTLHFKEHYLQKTLKASVPPEDTCDVLVFKDGSEIRGKVKEIGINEIKYKRCDTPNGPMYISKKSDLFMIKYANGTREVVKSEEQPRQKVQAPPPVQTRTNANYRKDTYSRQVHPLAIASIVLASLSIFILYFIAFTSATAVIPGAVFFLPFAAALAAVIAGVIAMRRIREQPEIFKGKGAAVTGFVIGLVIVGIYLLVLLVLLLFLGII